MFNARYFAPRYFAPFYFSELGANPTGSGIPTVKPPIIVHWALSSIFAMFLSDSIDELDS